MNYYFSQTHDCFEENMRVDLDLSKFATKVLLKSWTSRKLRFRDELDADELKPVPGYTNKPVDVVDNEVVKICVW